MIATALPHLYDSGARSSAQAISTTHTSGALNGRTLTSAPPASPRISRHSSWWAAFTEGGFKGLHQWIIRTREDHGLSVADHDAKPAKAEAALRTILKLDPAHSQAWAHDVNTRLKDAIWYGYDPDKLILSILLEMTDVGVTHMQKYCEEGTSLAWLGKIVAEQKKEADSLSTSLKNILESSVVLSRESSSMCSVSQTALWNEADAIFNLAFRCNLKKSVADQLLNNNVSKLLPLAKHKLSGVKIDSKVLAEFCSQAEENLKKSIVIWPKLVDGELKIFSELVKNDGFKHMADACKLEQDRRKNIAEKNEVFTYFNTRLSLLVATSPSKRNMLRRSLAELPCPKLKKDELAEIVASVIAKASPKVVMKVAKLTSNFSKSQHLIGAAKRQLDRPNVKLLEHHRLVEYLRLPMDPISVSARKLLEEEASKRAKKAGDDSMEILKQGLESNSYRALVRTVLEFSKLDKQKTDLQAAVSITKSLAPEKMPAYFSSLAPKKILTLQHLAIKLREHNEIEAANHLSSFIGQLGRQVYQSLPPEEDNAMSDAVLAYFPKTGVKVPQLPMTSLNEKLKNKYVADLIESHDGLDLARKARNNTEDLPVCIQFVKDLRSPNLCVANRPVDGYSLVYEEFGEIPRAKEFIKDMRSQKFTDAQIMTASRLGCQNSANALTDMISAQKLYSLTDAERQRGGYDGMKIGNVGLFPAGLGTEVNVVKNPNGNMEVHLRLFKDKVKEWRGELASDSIATDPEHSSFLGKLKFEVDEKGQIFKDNVTFDITYSRKITRFAPLPMPDASSDSSVDL